jgi:hypothetical protein
MIKSALGFGLALVAVVGAGVGGSAVAMTSVDPASVQCSVKDVGKLPAGLSASSVCATIREAVAPALASAGVTGGELSVQVTVHSDSKVTAAATLAGKALPEQRVATSDRALNANAIAMLGRAIAAEIAADGRN